MGPYTSVGWQTIMTYPMPWYLQNNQYLTVTIIVNPGTITPTNSFTVTQ